MSNSTSQDGTPVTFNLPVDMTTVKAEYFEWAFQDGTKRKAACAIPGGRPAGEPNEQQTIALVGNAGGWSYLKATALTIVGDLMLIAKNGTRVSAKGLSYSGPAMAYENGIELLAAQFERFTADGEATHGKGYPNHCQMLFPKTTHRVRLLFDGGVTLDGVKPITPDRTDLVLLLDSAAGAAMYPPGKVLGLADLGATLPRTQCEKDTYVTDGDNYLDICLALVEADPAPSVVHLPCGPTTQITAPKGLVAPCVPQSINVTLVL